jgi:Ca-activated chloride channel family protein
MSYIWHDFHFLRPQFLVLLPLLWGLVFWLARRRRQDEDWSALIDAPLLPALRLIDDAKAGMRPWPLLALAWSIAAIALAGPAWQRNQTPAYRASDAWLFVLDLSPSMMTSDIAPNRITRARYALDDLLGVVRDARAGLVVFSDAAYTVTPLTQDVATVKALLSPLSPEIMPSAGDHLAPALLAAEKLIHQAGAKNQHVVVLTDGFDDPAAAFPAAAALKSKGATVTVVGIGTAGGSPLRGLAPDANRLDVDKLRELAQAGGGRYVDIAGVPGLIATLLSTSVSAESAVAVQGVKVSSWRDEGFWLLPLLLLLAALLGRRGWF